MAKRTSTDTMKYVRDDRESFSELRKKNWGTVRALNGGEVTIRWNLSEHFKQHKLVELIVQKYIDGERQEIKLVVPVEELEHYLRMS